MRFRNKRTGAEVLVPCRLEGPDWEEVTEAKAAPKKEEAPKKAAPKKTVKKGS